LLVEDEIFLAWMLGDMIETLGYKMVGPATRVDEAMALIEAHDLDAAILDVNLNGEMSYPVAERLAAQGVPFVFATGYGDSVMIPDHLHGIPVVRKPVSTAVLADMLAAVLQ